MKGPTPETHADQGTFLGTEVVLDPDKVFHYWPDLSKFLHLSSNLGVKTLVLFMPLLDSIKLSGEGVILFLGEIRP